MLEMLPKSSLVLGDCEGLDEKEQLKLTSSKIEVLFVYCDSMLAPMITVNEEALS